MRWISLLLLILMFWGCSADYDVDVYEDYDSRAETSYSLKNRSLSLKAPNEIFKYVGSVTTDYTFRPDSVKLYSLDSLFNAYDGIDAQCDVYSMEINCAFDSRNYDSPLVKFVVFGSWKRSAAFIRKGQLEFLVDIGQDSAYFLLDMKQSFMSSRILHYMKEYGYPYYVANKLAHKDVGRSYKDSVENKLGLFFQIYQEDEDFNETFDAAHKSYGDSLRVVFNSIRLADFVLENYEMGCGDYNDLCMLTYDLDTCSSEYYVDTVREKNSKFYGSTLVCNKNYGWKLHKDLSDSLPLCSNYQEDLVYKLDDSSFLICKDRGWEAGDYGQENRKYILGSCSDYEVKIILDRYFYCLDGEWKDASRLDYDIGICGIQIEYGQVFGYNDTVAICQKSFGDYEETVGNITLSRDRKYNPPPWRWADEIVSYGFRTGQTCSRESDTLQILQYKSRSFGCFDYNDSYRWMEIGPYDRLYSYYVEKTDSTDRVMYGLYKNHYFYVTPNKSEYDYRDVRYVYSTAEKHLYGTIVLDSIMWLDSALTKKGTGTWESLEKLCPDGFRIPSVYEWGAYSNLVKRGEARAIKTDTTSNVAVFYKTRNFAFDGYEIGVYFSGRNGVATLESTVWPQKAEASIVCVKDI